MAFRHGGDGDGGDGQAVVLLSMAVLSMVKRGRESSQQKEAGVTQHHPASVT